MDPDAIRKARAFDSPWYYSIELAPSVWTRGREHRNVALTRDLLRRVDVEDGGADASGARCLDVGMQEGLVSVLLERRGASEIVGYDRELRRGRLKLVQRALDVTFDLVGEMKLQDLPAALVDERRDPFDVVIFSGVLYHMFDPLGGLATVRGLVRDGGICLIETAVAIDDLDAMHFNSRGRFSPRALWFFTPRILDYLMRFLRLVPLDVVYFGGARRPGSDQPPQGRLAVACRAVPDPVAEAGDEWMAKGKDADFAEFLDWKRVASNAPAVGYDESREGLVRRDNGSVDLQATVEATSPYEVRSEETRLSLDARY